MALRGGSMFQVPGNGMAAADPGDANRDTFSGGGGNDTIYVDRGEKPDTVNCGAGTDKVFADPEDKVASDCEEVLLTTAENPSMDPVVNTPQTRTSAPASW